MRDPAVRRAGGPPLIATFSPPAPRLTRLAAWLRAGHYDRMLAAGEFPFPGTALELHARRLVSINEREAVARSLRRSLAEARNPLPQWAARTWIHRTNVAAAADVIDTVTLRLHSPRPVTTTGMARLRLLLSDGTGPLYVHGGGDLTIRLESVLAALEGSFR